MNTRSLSAKEDFKKFSDNPKGSSECGWSVRSAKLTGVLRPLRFLRFRGERLRVSRGDRDCVGPLSRCCARTTNSRSREGKRTALNGARAESTELRCPKKVVVTICEPPAVSLCLAQGFSFSLRPLFPLSEKGRGLRGGFSLTYLFLLAVLFGGCE